MNAPVSPQVAAASQSTRRPEDVIRTRAENALAAAIFSGHPAGMTSRGAAMNIERELMTIALADIAEVLVRIRTYAKTSEVMEHALDGFADSIGDAIHDHGVTEQFWTSRIEEMR